MTDNSLDTEIFFSQPLDEGADETVFSAIKSEAERQSNSIELIAAENLVSKAVTDAMGTILTNKYAEGYPGGRYYGGCEHVDTVEQIAIDRAKELFGAKHVNVQPHSGSQANFGAYVAILPVVSRKPGAEMPDGVNHLGQMKIVGLSLDAGGHLTHGAAANASGIFFDARTYGLNEEGEIDYDEMENLVVEHKPRVLVGGASAYAGQWDMERMTRIAHDNNALFMFDMAHVAGLVAAGVHPNPVEYADIVTTTTHKTLRGPRGGMILTNNPDLVIHTTAKGNKITLGSRIDSRIFPGIQGGPLMHVIAAKAVAFGEALKPEFKQYGHDVIDNAKALAETLIERDIDVIGGGTTNHLMLVDLRSLDEGKGLEGNLTESVLELAGLTANKNAVPDDAKPRKVTSGLRLGTPAGTTRGFGQDDFRRIGNLIADIIHALANISQETRTELARKLMDMPKTGRTMHDVLDGQLSEIDEVLATARRDVDRLCQDHPIYPGMGQVCTP